MTRAKRRITPQRLRLARVIARFAGDFATFGRVVLRAAERAGVLPRRVLGLVVARGAARDPGFPVTRAVDFFAAALRFAAADFLAARGGLDFAGAADLRGAGLLAAVDLAGGLAVSPAPDFPGAARFPAAVDFPAADFFAARGAPDFLVEADAAVSVSTPRS